MKTYKVWFLAIRPKTLTAALVPILASSALVYKNIHSVSWFVVVCCVLASLSIQIATNLINDAIDFKKGADTHERIGPTRVTQSGLMGQREMLVAIAVVLFMAVVWGLPLVWIGGWPILLVGGLSLFLAYSYTGGPWPLAYLGLGDIFVILFFGLISVGGVYFLQSGVMVSDEIFVLGLQIGLLATVLIAINNLRDINQDVKANKKTIPVRFGAAWAKREIYFLLTGPFILQIFWFQKAGYWAAFLPLIILPLAVYIAIQIQKTAPSTRYNQFLALSALLHAGFGVLISLGLYLS